MHQVCQQREDYRKLWDELAKKKNRMPSVVTMGWNVLRAMQLFIQQPGFVIKEHYKARLDVCDECPGNYRVDRRCSKCGCGIDHKAQATSWTCDLGYWKEVDERFKDGQTSK